MNGGGADIWGTADAFQFVYTILPTNGSISARVASVEFVRSWTKAGVMLSQSLELWRTAFDKNPQLSEIGVNLGKGLCAVGDADGARATLQRVLKHNPDMGVARSALAEIAQRGCR